ncbi:SDR family oxidoreductase [Amycolatopsis panacis]|uniref:SDR family oxidoreductase n=1 Tax=Amycolatopsis panacis TaxID=2340917 RepID=A0A419I687_9PSEU|nr:SDR family oxidoreductase [Amycolatopsis panacis]RJQ86808.1 SDR family oxidoreductase [Amycolatopsis panacis]
MRVFVTGASGHLGSAVVPELLRAGHEVTCLARSDASAATVTALGAQVHRGNLDDLDGLRQAAQKVDAVIHLAFDHSGIATGKFAEAVEADHAVVQTFGEALSGTGKAFFGIGSTGSDGPDRNAAINANPRAAVARTLAEFAEHDVRTVLFGIPPVTHSSLDRHGFVPRMIQIARETGISAYVGDNRWPAAHTLDVARLYALALDKAPAGTELVAAAEEGIPVREIAETIGRHLDLPVKGISTEQAAEHFATFPFVGMDITMPNAETRRLLGWEPTHPGLLDDLEEGHYFAAGR